MDLQTTTIRSLKISNYRSLKFFSISPLQPFSVFLGKNGSGKSTVLDAMQFLSNCIQYGLYQTCKDRGGIHELLSKDSSQSLEIQIELYDDENDESMIYSIHISQKFGTPYVAKEKVYIPKTDQCILEFESGIGVSRFYENGVLREQNEKFVNNDILAITIFGNFSRFRECHILYKYLSHLKVFDFQIHNLRNIPVFEKETLLTQNGDNMANILYTLQNDKPSIFTKIVENLQKHIPSLDSIEARYNPMLNVNQIFMIDKGFPNPIGVNYISSGTLKMLAYYILLLQPNDHSFIGLEEPENYIHPSFIQDLAEFCRETSENKQIIISTHSPFFVNEMNPGEVWVCRRNQDGTTMCENLMENKDLINYVENGAKIGHLWSEGFVEE
jgi:predicted ATPase